MMMYFTVCRSINSAKQHQLKRTVRLHCSMTLCKGITISWNLCAFSTQTELGICNKCSLNVLCRTLLWFKTTFDLSIMLRMFHWSCTYSANQTERTNERADVHSPLSLYHNSKNAQQHSIVPIHSVSIPSYECVFHFHVLLTSGSL